MAISPDIDLDLLPQSLQAIVELIGTAPAIALVERYGGIRCCVPHTVTRDHALAQCIGLKAARRLAEEYGGETLELPLAIQALRHLRDQEIIRRLEDGESASKLAREFNTTRRNIFLIKSKSNNLSDPNLSLFG